MAVPGPRREPLGGGRGRGGGYECEFVEPPPEILQTECSVCLQILREPTIVSCCGYSFCRTCIERVQASRRTCPLCGASESTAIPEKKLQRLLSGRQVWCAKKEVGCEWTGELSKLDKHLNVAPEPERRLEGCAFVEVECSFCRESLQRRAIVEHEDDQCPQRPYSCDYCRDYEASFNDVVNKHYPVCKRYPLRCPNKCDELPEGFKYMIERQDLEHHMKEECSLTVVECDFHYAGCGAKLPHKDMAGHLAESLVAHMSLLAVHGKKAIERIEELERENRSLKDRLHSHLLTPPVMFTMTNFEQHKRSKDTWYSSPFYTHPHGYKMCVEVSFKDDKWFLGAILMRGEFDDCLQWPFQSDVHIQVLNQLSDYNHITVTGDFSCGPAFGNVGVRVTVGERQLKGRGEDIPFAILSCSTENCQYLRDDCIQVQVARVVDTVQLQREIVATVDHRSLHTPPCQFIMRDFEQHKKDGDIWYSPSFFIQGYRMCLHVYANGYSTGRGTHVSVYTNFMCSEFDSDLKWPFRGDITIQLLNQLRNRNHHTKTIHYTDKTIHDAAGRVTVGERGWGWGFNYFISHSGLTQAKKEYLKDGCLIFKITKTEAKII